MPPKRKYLFVSIAIILFIGLTVVFKPDLLLSGRMLYSLGLNKYNTGDHGDYYDDDKIKSAAWYFEKAIGKGLKTRDVFDKLALCYLVLDDERNADRAFTMGLEYFPKDAEFYFYRGNSRKEIKDFKGALADYSAVIEVQPIFKYISDAYYYRGAMSYLLGDTIRAETDRIIAQKGKDHELRTYADYCQLFK